MFIKKKYQRRHKLLKLFYDNFFEGNSPNADVFDTSLTFPELEKVSNLTTEQLVKTIDYLVEAEEICIEEIDYTSLYIITLKGRSAYHDKKYLYTGKREFLNDTYDIIKTVSAIILLIIAVITFIQNSIDIKQNKKDIETLKKDINQIKSSKK
jgi:hypothetical protein